MSLPGAPARSAAALALAVAAFAACNVVLGNEEKAPRAEPDAGAVVLGDSKRCGSPARDCLGGACLEGTCRPVVLLRDLRAPTALRVQGGRLYWNAAPNGACAGGRIATATTDGEDLRVVADDLGCTTATTLYGDHVVWAELAPDGRAALKRAPTAGGAVEVLTAALPSLHLAADPSGVTWAETPPQTSRGLLRRVDHDGGGAALIATLDHEVTALATDATTVYWGEDGAARALRRGADAGVTLGAGGARVSSLVVDGDAVLWIASAASGPSEVGSVIERIRPGGAAEVLVAGLTNAGGLVAQGGSLHFVSLRDGARTLQRAPRDGGEPVVVTTLPTGTTSFAVDDRAYYLSVAPDTILRLAR